MLHCEGLRGEDLRCEGRLWRRPQRVRIRWFAAASQGAAHWESVLGLRTAARGGAAYWGVFPKWLLFLFWIEKYFISVAWDVP